VAATSVGLIFLFAAHSVISSPSSSCTITAEGTGFYVTVTSDTGQSIQGAQVSGTRIMYEGICEERIGVLRTNSSGSVLIAPNMGSYYVLTIQYQGNSFSAKAPIVPMASTYVVLRVPSGNITVREIPEGGCQRSSAGISCHG
jgi:hypothetical protein